MNTDKNLTDVNLIQLSHTTKFFTDIYRQFLTEILIYVIIANKQLISE